MKARVYESETQYKDIEIRDNVKEIQRIYIGTRVLDIVGDLGGDVAYRRTTEIENGRVVFR